MVGKEGSPQKLIFHIVEVNFFSHLIFFHGNNFFFVDVHKNLYSDDIPHAHGNNF
jgi:hypothetical protein